MAEQALVQEELLWLAKREREAASEAKERSSILEERQKTAQLVSNKPLLCFQPGQAKIVLLEGTYLMSLV